MNKIGGVGLVNLIVIWLFVMIMTVGAKGLATKYNVAGLSDIILAM